VPEPLFRLAVSTSGATVVLGRTPTTFVAGTPPTDKPNRRRTAGTELARWFLHLYGPALPEHFAAWRGFPAASGHEKFTMLGDEVTPVTFDGRRAWALTTDLPVLTGAPSAKGVRLLPRDDPFTAQRDRATFAPTKERQRRLWTGLGTSAVVLVDGALAGLWRGRKERGRFTVTVEAIRPIPVPARKLLEAEAAEFASFRGASDSAVQINPK
jgi:hypothetical protein